MQAQGTVTESDFVAAQYLHMRPRPVAAALGLTLSVAVLVALIISFSVVMFAVVAFLVVYFFVFVPWRARRIYREYKALSEPVSMEVRDDGLHFVRENGSGLVPWSHVVKWRANKSMVLVYPNRSMFYLVPSHFFGNAEEFDGFRDALAKRVGGAA